MNSPFKFPRRVRIHGGECGAVARALHHEAQKVALTQNEQSLISDEKAFSRQADLKKSFGSTFIERKQMSTKTTFKRIALVAVASLGFGMLSVAPSTAAVSFTGMYVSKTSSSNYATADLGGTLDCPVAGTTCTLSTATGTISLAANIGKAIYTIDNGYIGTIASITTTTVFELTAVPTIDMDAATNGAVGSVRIGTPAATYTTSAVINANQISSLTVTAGRTVGLEVAGGANANAAGQMRAILDGFGVVSAEIDNTTLDHFMIPFTAPLSPGTYPMTIEYSEDGTFDGIIANTSKITLSLVVTAASGLSTALSTAFIMGPAAGAGAGNVTTNAATYSAVRASGTKIAQVEVTLRNADGTAAAAGHTVAASVSGSGFVTVDTTADTAAGSARASSAAASNAGLAYVHIAADGTAGTGTITVSVTDAVTSATTVLGTFTVTSFGPVSKIEVSTTNYTIGLATGDTTGRAVAARGNAADTTGALDDTTLTPAFIVKTTDSVGNVANIANALVPTIVSSNPVSVSGGTCVADDGLGVYSSGEGVGYYNCSFTTTALSKSGDKATLTIRTLDPATGTTYLTTTLDVTVGGGRLTETLSLDKASYNPGEAMVVTRTAVDSAGNPVADGSAAPLVVFNKAVGGSAPGADFYNGGTVATSATRPAVFAPTSSGAFEARMSGRSGSTATVAIIATATVGDDASTAAANAASDAASEAIDAANAATDAANLAAEAADAATVAAEEARDAADAATAAVEALATEVATLMAALKAQITTLANTVAKIAKKVKA